MQILQVTEWLIETWKALWNFFLNGGYIGLFIILYPVLRKLVHLMRQFTN